MRRKLQVASLLTIEPQSPYEITSHPAIIDYFTAKGLVHVIKADQSIEAVTAEIKQILDAAQ